MAKKPMIKKSHEGLLHKELGVAKGKKIGEKRLHAAARSAKKSGNVKEERRVIWAENMNKKKGK
jgi:hypothetical protein